MKFKRTAKTILKAITVTVLTVIGLPFILIASFGIGVMCAVELIASAVECVVE